MRPKPWLHAILLISLFSFSGCDKINRALNQLDDLKTIFSDKSGDVLTEMQKWRNDLPKDVRSLINDDVEKLSKDVIGSLGSETKCSFDFLRDRFKQTVDNIKLKIQGWRQKNYKPCFCTLNMPLLDPNANSKSIQALSFYGYDFFS